MKASGEELLIAFASLSRHLVDAPDGPSVNGRIDVAESELVGGNLPVRMHVPFAKKENELVFSELGIDASKGNHVKSEIPRSILKHI